MKRLRILTGLVVLVIFSMAANSVLAAPSGSSSDAPQAKPTQRPHGKPTDAPSGEDGLSKQDAQATQRAERAAERERRHHRVHFRGSVTAVDAASISLDTDQGGMTFTINEETRINLPTSRDAGAADINVGSQAAVLAIQEEDDSFTALSIQVVPSKPVHIHHVGVVTEYIEGVSITIEATDGDLITFLIGEDFKILPEERADTLAAGQRVTIIARRDPAGGELTAQGVVIHPETTDTETSETETPEPTETPTPTPGP
jgi:Domain of unknown function (DUF5666)